MARDFNGTSDYLEHGAAVVGAVPITLACWCRIDDVTTSRVLMSIGDSAADTKVYLFVNAAPSLVATTVAVGGTSAGASRSGFTTGIWQHVCGVFASATDRRALLNGVTGTTNTTSIVLGTPTVTTIGARYTAGVRGLFVDGCIAEAAVWDVALDDREVSMLALGYSPLLVRPASLQAYWPLIGRYSPETDVRGGFNGTVTGAVVGDHPRIIYKRRSSYFVPPAFVPPFQYARPDSDITEGGWLPSSGGSLYAMVDELVADDADRMRSNTGAAADAVLLGLSDITTPEAGDVSITIRHRTGT